MFWGFNFLRATLNDRADIAHFQPSLLQGSLAGLVIGVKINHFPFVNPVGVNSRFRNTPDDGNRPGNQVEKPVQVLAAVPAVAACEIEISKSGQNV